MPHGFGLDVPSNQIGRRGRDEAPSFGCRANLCIVQGICEMETHRRKIAGRAIALALLAVTAPVFSVTAEAQTVRWVSREEFDRREQANARLAARQRQQREQREQRQAQRQFQRQVQRDQQRVQQQMRRAGF